jgi:hypothetical protein
MKVKKKKKKKKFFFFFGITCENPILKTLLKKKKKYIFFSSFFFKRVPPYDFYCSRLELFFQELNPLFEKCLQYFDEQLLNIECAQKVNINKIDNFLSDIKISDQNQINLVKFKRHSTYVNDIVKMIGNNGKLYFNAVNNSLKLFLNTKN